MLPSLSRGLRLALMTTLTAGYLVGHPLTTYAQEDDEEDEGDDGGADAGAGGDDGEDADVEDDKDQPAMTAGGLYTLRTFPVRELFRPLTITQQITQLRAGIGTDVSNKGAFESVGVNLEALHGYRDNFMVVGGFTSAYNFQQFNAYFGFEGALAYDLLDFRLAARIGRTATDVDPDVNEVKYEGGGVKASLDIGFPFRYVARPEIAIIALNTLMSIDFNGKEVETMVPGSDPPKTVKSGNGAKPDLNPSLGISTNPIAPLSVVIFATLQVIDFDFTDRLTVPATARIQFSPNQKFDIGGEFTFLNLKPEGEAKFYNDRFLTLFFALRVGK